MNPHRVTFLNELTGQVSARHATLIARRKSRSRAKLLPCPEMVCDRAFRNAGSFLERFSRYKRPARLPRKILELRNEFGVRVFAGPFDRVVGHGARITANALGERRGPPRPFQPGS